MNIVDTLRRTLLILASIAIASIGLAATQPGSANAGTHSPFAHTAHTRKVQPWTANQRAYFHEVRASVHKVIPDTTDEDLLYAAQYVCEDLAWGTDPLGALDALTQWLEYADPAIDRFLPRAVVGQAMKHFCGYGRAN